MRMWDAFWCLRGAFGCLWVPGGPRHARDRAGPPRPEAGAFKVTVFWLQFHAIWLPLGTFGLLFVPFWRPLLILAVQFGAFDWVRGYQNQTNDHWPYGGTFFQARRSPVFLEIHVCSQLSVALLCAFTLSWPPSPGENPGSQASSQCTLTFSSTIHQSTSIPFHFPPFLHFIHALFS